MNLASVIIIHYVHDHLTYQVLECLDRHQYTSPAEVIVVDNGSPRPFKNPNLPRLGFPRVLRLARGKGFGAACQSGVDAISPGCRQLPAILLNNDISFDDDLVGGLIASLRDHPRAGLIGPRLVFPDGRFQLSWGDDLTISSEWREWRRQAQMRRGKGALYRDRIRQSATPRQVDWISGGAFLVTPDTIEAIGGLDRGYYFYFEDCDWSRRARQAGKEVWFDPNMTVRHALGAARPASSKDPNAVRFYRSRQLGRLRYYDLFSSWFQFQGIRAVIAMRVLSRGDFEMFAELCRRGRGRARRLPTAWKQSEPTAALDSGKSELV